MPKMKKTIIAGTLASLVLASCASAPKPVVPDGSSRAPVNSDVAIQQYRAQSTEAMNDYTERTALTRQVDALSKQVADLKAYLLHLQTSWDSRNPKARPAQQEGPAPVAAQKKVTQTATHSEVGMAGLRPNEHIEMRDQAVVFRVSEKFNKATFEPSPTLQTEVLQAARASDRVDIRGRTDGKVPDAGNEKVAIERALNVRLFLVNNGISPQKINVSHLAAGDHIADNNTAAGRAQNRRVEIEASGADVPGQKATAAPQSKAVPISVQGRSM